MKKSLKLAIVGGVLSASFSSSYAAGVSLTLDNPYQSAIQGFTTVLSFTGKIDIDPGYRIGILSLTSPGLSSGGPFLGTSFSSSLINFLNAANQGDDYTGELFKITVNSSDAAGYYFQNGPGFSNLTVYATGTPGSISDSKAYGVIVKEAGEPSVPGPAAAIPMALGLAGSLIRRRQLGR